MKGIDYNFYAKIGSYNQAQMTPYGSLDWLPCDTKERFDDNLKTSPTDKNLLYYLDNPIKYNLNSKGFRTPDEFSIEDEGNVFLGCSHTVGIGLPLEKVWSYKVSQRIGGLFWNLGIGGTGPMTHFRVLLGFHKQMKIKNIFHFAPKYGRYEFLVNGEPEPIQLNHGNDWFKYFGKSIDGTFLDYRQQSYFHHLCYYGIKGLAEEIGAKYHCISDLKYDSLNNPKTYIDKPNVLRARDLVHFDEEIHQTICDDFLNLHEKSNNGGLI